MWGVWIEECHVYLHVLGTCCLLLVFSWHDFVREFEVLFETLMKQGRSSASKSANGVRVPQEEKLKYAWSKSFLGVTVPSVGVLNRSPCLRTCL